MLHYPKMPSARDFPEGKCVAFEKIDGTNLHYDRDAELGWFAFGTRRTTYDLDARGFADFDAAHPGMSDAAAIFLRDFAGPLDEVLRGSDAYRDYGRVSAFCEYVGPGSFAGEHRPGDAMKLVLFDVMLHGFGFVGPEAFVDDFGHLPIPRVVFRGKFSGKLTEDVRKGRFGVAEGVVIKAGQGGEVAMAKVKTAAYAERLRERYGRRWEEYWE